MDEISGALMRKLGDRGVAAGVAVAMLALGVLVLLCNGLDWDAFFAFNEVDRRAWLLDRRLPLWSYQLCAGVTRIGDPQAFGLSPLFLLVIVFGSFWGTKLMTILAAGIGLYFSYRLLALFAAEAGSGEDLRGPLLTLSTLFVVSNFFLWHLAVGHFTFISFFFGLGILYFSLEAYLHGLSRGQFAVAVFVGWQHFSGGFFHSTVYLLVPFFIAFALFVGLDCARDRSAARSLWRRLGQLASFLACGLLIASYKLIAVWQQQQRVPRSLEAVDDSSSVLQLVAYQLLPTFGPDWPVSLGSASPWDLHESSAFSLLPIALAILAVRRLASGKTRREQGGRLGWLVGIYASVCVALILGNVSGHAPFTLLNQWLFEGAVRVAPRFGVGLTLSLAMACAWMVGRLGRRALGSGICVALLLLSVANVGTFAWLFDRGYLWELASLPASGESRMSRQVMVPHRHGRPGHQLEVKRPTQTYRVLRAGNGVPNCFNALPRVALHNWPERRELPLIDERFGEPPAACIESSFFTQNQIRIADSCPRFVCLNIAGVNSGEERAGVQYDATRRRFCRAASR